MFYNTHRIISCLQWYQKRKDWLFVCWMRVILYWPYAVYRWSSSVKFVKCNICSPHTSSHTGNTFSSFGVDGWGRERPKPNLPKSPPSTVWSLKSAHLYKNVLLIFYFVLSVLLTHLHFLTCPAELAEIPPFLTIFSWGTWVDWTALNLGKTDANHLNTTSFLEMSNKLLQFKMTATLKRRVSESCIKIWDLKCREGVGEMSEWVNFTSSATSDVLFAREAVWWCWILGV